MALGHHEEWALSRCLKEDKMKEYAKIKSLGACRSALEWLQSYTDPQKAWGECERGDWMLWLLSWQSEDSEPRKKLVYTACQCARLALPNIKDERARKCIETTEAWIRGEASIAQVKDARSAAYDAAFFAASDVAYDAAYAAFAAAAYVSVATYAAYADDVIAAHASVAIYADDVTAVDRKQCANIVREHYPDPPTL